MSLRDSRARDRGSKAMRMAKTVALQLSVVDATLLLALLRTSDTFPDVVDALIEALATGGYS